MAASCHQACQRVAGYEFSPSRRKAKVSAKRRPYEVSHRQSKNFFDAKVSTAMAPECRGWYLSSTHSLPRNVDGV